MLTGIGSLQASTANEFISLMGVELSHFHVQGLYVIGGIIAAGLAFYFVTHKFGKEEKPVRQKISFSQQRRQHHRVVIKKTS